MNQIKAEVVIPIPETHIIIEKTKFEEIEQQVHSEWATGLEWLSNQTSIKSPLMLREKILYPYKEELLEFVYFPTKQSENWRFNVFYMKKWLRENFYKIHMN